MKQKYKIGSPLPILIFAIIGVLLLVVVIAAPGGIGVESEEASLSGGDARVVRDSDASDGEYIEFRPREANSDDPISVNLSSDNTGLKGAINAGLWDGDASDPYDGLKVYRGEQRIDDDWLDDNNGGSKTIEGADFQGNVVVFVPDVTLRYCRIQSDARYTLSNRGETGGERLAKNMTVEWCELEGPKDGQCEPKVIYGSAMTIRRSELTWATDGIFSDRSPVGSIVVEENFIHNQRTRPQISPCSRNDHGDQIQIYNNGTNIIRDNKLIGNYQQSNSPIQINRPTSGPTSVNIIEGNYFFGGNFGINGGNANNSDTVFEENYFAYDSYRHGCIGVISGGPQIGTNYWWEWLDGIRIDKDRTDQYGNFLKVPLPDPPSDMPPNGTEVSSSCV